MDGGLQNTYMKGDVISKIDDIPFSWGGLTARVSHVRGNLVYFFRGDSSDLTFLSSHRVRLVSRHKPFLDVDVI